MVGAEDVAVPRWCMWMDRGRPRVQGPRRGLQVSPRMSQANVPAARAAEPNQDLRLGVQMAYACHDMPVMSRNSMHCAIRAQACADRQNWCPGAAAPGQPQS